MIFWLFTNKLTLLFCQKLINIFVYLFKLKLSFHLNMSFEIIYHSLKTLEQCPASEDPYFVSMIDYVIDNPYHKDKMLLAIDHYVQSYMSHPIFRNEILKLKFLKSLLNYSSLPEAQQILTRNFNIYSFDFYLYNALVQIASYKLHKELSVHIKDLGGHAWSWYEALITKDQQPTTSNLWAP